MKWGCLKPIETPWLRYKVGRDGREYWGRGRLKICHISINELFGIHPDNSIEIKLTLLSKKQKDSIPIYLVYRLDNKLVYAAFKKENNCLNAFYKSTSNFLVKNKDIVMPIYEGEDLAPRSEGVRVWVSTKSREFATQ